MKARQTRVPLIQSTVGSENAQNHHSTTGGKKIFFFKKRGKYPTMICKNHENNITFTSIYLSKKLLLP